MGGKDAGDRRSSFATTAPPKLLGAVEDPASSVRDGWLAAAMGAAAAAAAGRVEDERLRLARAAREQTMILQRYARICGALSRYALWLRSEGCARGAALVPAHFPVRLTPRTEARFHARTASRPDPPLSVPFDPPRSFPGVLAPGPRELDLRLRDGARRARRARRGRAPQGGRK